MQGKCKYYFFILVMFCSSITFSQNGNWRSYLSNAEKAAQAGKYYKAAKNYELAAGAKNNKKDYLFQAGRYYLISRDYEKAVACLSPVKEKTKTYPKVLYYYGLAEKGRGNYEVALQALSVFSSDYKGADRGIIIGFVENEMRGCELGRRVVSENIQDSILVQRLDDNVNSEFNEAAPIVIKEDLLYFSSNKEEHLRIYRSRLTEEGWSVPEVPESLPLIRQSDFCHGSFSPDFTKFYFSVCKDYEGEWREDELSCGIYYSELVGNSWTEARALGRLINLTGAVNIQPHVTYEGKEEVLYFVSNRSGGQGGMDIWFVKKPIREGIMSFGYPQNAGIKINTSANEFSPFYDYTQATLFFSSDGKPGLGGLDVFGAVGTQDNWLDVYALNPPINSSSDDYYYSPFQGGNKGFFVSNRLQLPSKLNTVDNDLFFFEPIQEEVDSVLLSGLILDMDTEKGLENASVEIFEFVDTDKFELVESLILKAYNFEYMLEAGREYMVYIQKEGYMESDIFINSEDLEDNYKFYLSAETEVPSIDPESYPEGDPDDGSNPSVVELPEIDDLDELPVDEGEENGIEEVLPNDFRIQVAALRSPDDQLLRSLDSFGKVIIEEIDGLELKRVLIGGFEKRQEAEKTLSAMKKESKMYSSAFIILYKDGKRQ